MPRGVLLLGHLVLWYPSAVFVWSGVGRRLVLCGGRRCYFLNLSVLVADGVR